MLHFIVIQTNSEFFRAKTLQFNLIKNKNVG